MPDIFIGLAIILLMLFIVTESDSSNNPLVLTLFIIPIGLGLWLYNGIKHNEVRQIGTFVSAEVDGVAVLNIDGEIVNLNKLLSVNVEPGTKFEVSTYRNYSKGVYCTFNNQYDIKEVK